MKVASQCGEKTARRLCFFGLRWALLASALLSLAACKDDNYSLGDQAPLADCTLVGPAPSEQLQKTAAAVAVGQGFTCAVTVGGAANCWGDNSFGQLGNACVEPNVESPAPVKGLSTGVTAIAVGTAHACAIQLGNVFCWGDNFRGQLGDGSNVPRAEPVAVTAVLGTFQGLSLGADHSCALSTMGTVACWGDNSQGQLGSGTINKGSRHAKVAGLSNVLKLVSGDTHNCALDSMGALRCWGGNQKGQLGNGGNAANPSATAIPGLAAVKDVAAGAQHTCIHLGDAAAGGIQCFGANDKGQLGDGTQAARNTPVQVSGHDGIGTQLAAGRSHSCAFWPVAGGDGSGTRGLHCWGDNSAGQLGVAKYRTLSKSTGGAKSLTPLRIEASYSRFEELIAGGNNTCFRAGGDLNCFGAGEFGQLGLGISFVFDDPSRGSVRLTPDATAPAGVLGFARAARSLTAGRNHNCVLLGPGAPLCWGQDDAGEMGNGGLAVDQLTPGLVAGLSKDIVAIEAGGLEGFGGQTCALTVAGAVSCWGYNVNGQLAIGTTGNQTTPAAVVGLNLPVTTLAAGTDSVCVVVNDGTLSCWDGSNSLGIGSATPISIAGLSNVVDAGVGWFYFCALEADGGVKCQGNGAAGALGDGSTFNNATPAPVIGVSDAVTISSGTFHSCVITRRGGLKCWGNGTAVGDGAGVDRTTAIDVPGMSSGVTAVATGFRHTCAVKSGAAFCWGFNGAGQLGDDSVTQQLLPTPVSGLGSGVVDVAVGQEHSCALLSSGEVRCWGRNQKGQLGNNSTTASLTAVKPPLPRNSAPIVSYLGDRVHPAGTQGTQQIPGFANITPGTGVDAGQLLQFGSVVADPDGVLTKDSLALDSNGTLRYGLTGISGAAVAVVRPRDNGGEDNNGSDLGDPFEFRVFVGEGADLKMVADDFCAGVSRRNFGSFCGFVPRLGNNFSLSADYRYEVSNKSPLTLNGASFGLSYAFTSNGVSKASAAPLSWTCTTTSGSCTPASGSGDINATFNLAPNEQAFVSVTGTVDASVRFVDMQARVSPPAGITAFLNQDDRTVVTRAAGGNSILRAGFE